MLNDHPRQQLRYIITQYGQTVCNDAKRCEALLRDFCPEHKRELNLLIAALKENVPQQLLKASPHVGIESTLKILTAQLHDNLGTAEPFAYWAVETWALSLNVLVQPIGQTAPPDTPPHNTPAQTTPKIQSSNVNQATVQVATPKIQAAPKIQTTNAANWVCPVTGMEFIKISKGSFMMGSPEDEPNRWWSSEKLHRVNIAYDFYFSKTLVTQAQWQAVMGSNPSYFQALMGSNPSYFNLPVEQVSWLDVQRFIAQLNHKTGQQYRLPTEAEWEYACRAGTSTSFHTGHVLTAKNANFGGTVWKTSAVGSYPPNLWGLYDMAGNVQEWTASVHDGNYKFSEQVSSNNDTSSRRVLRGGSWGDSTNNLRSACRCSATPTTCCYTIGFRLIRM